MAILGTNTDGSISVSSSAFTVGDQLFVGFGHTGTLLISESVTVTSVGTSEIGSASGSTGSVTVTDSGSL